MPFLSDMARHGKTRQQHKHYQQQQHYYYNYFQRMTVPKAWFRHFYLLGILTTLMFVALELPTTTTTINDATIVLRWICAMVLLLLHLVRRWYECYHVHSYGTSRMHIAGYVVGMLHYVMLPWNFTIIATHQRVNDSASHHHQQQHHSINTTSVLFFWMTLILGSSLCLYGQYEQHLHHVILSQLRRNKKDTKNNNNNSIMSTMNMMYAIPHGRWFVYVSCPHYLAEIGIYLGLVLVLVGVWMTPNNNNTVLVLPRVDVCALLVWVMTNLTVSAWNTHQWYLDTFGPNYAALQRSAIVPIFWS
jgi:3-oxo-5-alpha-steroid 4-dehydrogenase 3